MSLLIQIPVVILVTLACGSVARRLGQSRVIGEIVGGILLGPSVFGRFAPTAESALFPPSSMASFEILSTVGLILFLFLIGTEVNIEHLYHQRATAALSSTLSILAPFAIGVLLAHPLRTRFAPQGIGNLPFVLFLGIAMSITAFPVLARILEERGIQSTRLGTTAITCAAVDDLVAWILLAVALALVGVGGGPLSMAIRLIGLAIYLLVMIGVVRPIAARFLRLRQSRGLSIELLAVMVAFAFASAATTDALGLHPLFGAFLAGVCFPRINSLRETLRGRLEMLVSILLLPLFFALTGMRTRLDLLDKPTMWLWAGIVLLGAMLGKIGGATAAARALSGRNKKGGAGESGDSPAQRISHAQRGRTQHGSETDANSNRDWEVGSAVEILKSAKSHLISAISVSRDLSILSAQQDSVNECFGLLSPVASTSAKPVRLLSVPWSVSGLFMLWRAISTQ